MRKRNNPNALCERCNITTVSKTEHYPDGEVMYSKYCFPCKTISYVATKLYRAAKLKQCATCGFQGHFSQLDVDHKDGDHFNNNPSNLQTLCANCHRLKTYLQKRQK